MSKITLYYETLKHVKPTQLYHQIYYRLKNRISNKSYNGNPSQVVQLKLEKGIFYPKSFLGQNTFSFLNLEKQFSKIDWNFSEYGKLWTYNLNYFEFLHQEGISKEEGLMLIKKFISNGFILKDGLEPYPISLRGINWIKFLAENEIQNKGINTFLYNDYQRLADNLEYHLLGNHLLENGFSLLFGAYFFKNDQFYAKARKILIQELKEQVLKDGAHYELSPMYHQIILHRVLDSINLVQNNNWKEKELLSLLKEKAELMMGWLGQITFRNDQIPKLNDAADRIAPTTEKLKAYATQLEITKQEIQLRDSGYRKFKSNDFEVVIDVGQLAPRYQPGHSHADSLQFVLSYKNNPIIVDTGISTYDKNERRQLERSTSSHNTVTINDENSSEVWGGFRVAKRANVTIKRDSINEIEAQHDGYRGLGIIHNRKFKMQKGNFVIEDKILTKPDKAHEIKGHLHFHPNVKIDINENTIIINNNLKLEVSGINKLDIIAYDFAETFNTLRPARKIEYSFKEKAILDFHTVAEKV